MSEFAVPAILFLIVVFWAIGTVLLNWKPKIENPQLELELGSSIDQLTLPSPRNAPVLVCLGCDDLMEATSKRFFCTRCWVRIPGTLRLQIGEGYASDLSGETHGAFGRALDEARTLIQTLFTEAGSSARKG